LLKDKFGSALAYAWMTKKTRNPETTITISIFNDGFHERNVDAPARKIGAKGISRQSHVSAKLTRIGRVLYRRQYLDNHR
jgi:hypothetical protein